MIGATLGDRYELIRLLGKGGMGAVYEAKHVTTGQHVAIKLINNRHIEQHRDAVSRFRREARAISAVRSEHIVGVLDSGTDATSGVHYLVMEFLEGEDLQRLLKRLGPLPIDVVLRIAAQALSGLMTAHAAGVVHRDIKPANLFLAQRGGGQLVVKLLDFGIAKIVSGPQDLPQMSVAGLTTTGGFLGSPLYMSPEQVRSSRNVDHRTDLWSLGAALYCALAGYAPHGHATSVGELILSICTTAPKPLVDVAPWVPPEVAQVVHTLLQKDPGDRYPSAAAALSAVRPLLTSGDALHEEMIVPLPSELRALIAERSSAPWRVEGVGPRDPDEDLDGPTLTVTQGLSKSTMPGAPTPTPPALTEEKTAASRGSTPRSRAPLAVIAVVALGLCSLVAYLLVPPTMRLGAPDAIPPAGARPQAPAPTPAPSALGVSAALDATAAARSPATLRRVVLSVAPNDASVEVDGIAAEVRDGAVEIEGAPGSVHGVRLFKGPSELVAKVSVTEEGAQPPRLELRSPPEAASVSPPSPTRRKAAAPAASSAAPAQAPGLVKEFQ